MDPFLGEIRLVPYNFAPRGWAFCQGQLLPIAQYTALFALLGTTYGGDGRVTFGLPDMRDRSALGEGQGAGLSTATLGERIGAAAVALATGQIPSHTHGLNVSSAAATLPSPVGAHLAVAGSVIGTPYGSGTAGSMPNAVQPNPGGGSHENRQPYLVLNYIVALQGIFPSRN